MALVQGRTAVIQIRRTVWTSCGHTNGRRWDVEQVAGAFIWPTRDLLLMTVLDFAKAFFNLTICRGPFSKHGFAVQFEIGFQIGNLQLDSRFVFHVLVLPRMFQWHHQGSSLEELRV